MNIMIPDELFDLWVQAILKLDTLGTFRSYPIVMQAEPIQFLKLHSIMNNSHVSLLQLKVLYFFLATNISTKVLLNELNLEIFPCDLDNYNLKPLTSIIPPIIFLLSQHMSTKQVILRG